MKPVLLIGGGPAGSVCGGILASRGVPCVLFEKERHPRHHVGESLQPATLELLDHYLGVKDALAEAGYAYKFGAAYIWGESRDRWRLLFDQRLEESVDELSEEELLRGGYEHAWQVDRSSFDHTLIEAAKARGLDCREGEAVEEVLFDEAGRATVARLLSGETIEASFVVDASGQRAMIARQQGWVEVVEDLRSIAIYAYLEGAGGLPSPLGRHVQYVVTVPEGWLWFIPISEELTSVGLVTKEKRKVGEAEFLSLLERSELPIGGGRLIEKAGARIHYARDWSYASRRFSGEGFVLVGDAACFVDPILSGGVDFSVRGGANAAQAILRGLRDGRFEAPLREYEERVRSEYRAYLRMARYWYGNNRSVEGFFWEAQEMIEGASSSTPIRAFIYLTSGRYATDQHFKIFPKWQEKIMFEAIGVDREKAKEALRGLRRGR